MSINQAEAILLRVLRSMSDACRTKTSVQATTLMIVCGSFMRTSLKTRSSVENTTSCVVPHKYDVPHSAETSHFFNVSECTNRGF